MKFLKQISLAFLFLFSLNSEATLSRSTTCNNSVIANSLYQVTFEPFIDNDSYGRLELWMAFSQTGLMKSRQYFYGYDTYRGNRDVRLLSGRKYTNFQVATTNSNSARGCLAAFKIAGRSYDDTGTEYYSWNIFSSGFISRNNAANSRTDADYFTLNNAVINYGGVEAWGKLTFTQIR